MILPNCSKMPCWYYDKKDLKATPSIREGLDFDTELRYRKEGARFIIQCGTEMGLGHNTMATGVVYFHRFYMFHSFKSFPRYVTACCCLLLAGKVEETPKKCKDIIKNARLILTDKKFQSFGDDPKEEVMTLERILLQTIKFDLQVEHPYTFLVKYAKCLKGDQAKLQKMVQMAWNFVNDSLSTTVCLQWEPEIIAVAMIHLASKLSKFTVADWVGRQPQHLRWWDMFVSDVTMEILEDICHQVLDLYQQCNPELGMDSPPQNPPSKSSPPMVKRTKVSPTYKSSPNPGPGVAMIKTHPAQPVPSLIGVGGSASGGNVIVGCSSVMGISGAGDDMDMSNGIGGLINHSDIMLKPMTTEPNPHYAYGPPPPPYGPPMYPHPQFATGPPTMPVPGQMQSVPIPYGAHQYSQQPPPPVVPHYQPAGPPPPGYYPPPGPPPGRGGYY